MTEIYEFLTARYDEVEAAANAAVEVDPAPWVADVVDEGDTGARSEHGFGVVVAADGSPLWDDEGSRTLMMTAPTARHVAAHDPARVLADISARRKRLDMHRPNTHWEPRCMVCLSDRAGRLSDDWTPDAWPCKTILLDAASYTEHPDYQQKWDVDD